MSQKWVELQMEQQTQNMKQDGVRTLALLIVTGLNIIETTYPSEWARNDQNFDLKISVFI